MKRFSVYRVRKKKKLWHKNILLEIGDFYFIDKTAPYQGIRLSLAKLSEAQLLHGIPVLMEELEKSLNE